jgi:hypothetical protein
MTHDKQPTPELTKFPFVKPDEGILQVYSNYIDAAWTLFDVTIRFAQIVPLPRSGPEPHFEAEENVRVTVAWPEAKVLANIMTDLVKRFEEVNGEIKPLKLAPSPSDEEKKKLNL